MRVVVTPRYYLESPDRLKTAFPQCTHIISIQESAEKGKLKLPTPDFVKPENHHHFYFDDVLLDQDHLDGIMEPPMRDDYERLIEIAKSLPDDANLLVHCFAGVSRSPAVAIGILNVKLGDPTLAYEAFKKIPFQEGFYPNDRIVYHFDRILKNRTPGPTLTNFIVQWKLEQKEKLAEKVGKIILPFH